ncbi:class I SAM-dependent methyltransferase [Nocardia sp. CDC159]|uniref:Class I SAM-dependent methyltransferase n=1 Tax=Nocardia pulmonis TaxID=2951408 RepID=A0A9X2ECQ5_9NOCA|nr:MULTISPECIES: class I SAM-dependent methyltransferase [Nocardia]MCM6777980.1 class I SAM-dependent methyltransferase [Nocardia pulmonis]MCM6790849.1 class I SAM-dependent methyltransferase [Nocardia sp. CDC159]
MCSPFFGRWYSALMSVAEPVFLRPTRNKLLADARGRVLIIGLGPGHDLPYLPEAVTSVAAVEPNPTMRSVASARARRHGIAVDIHDAFAEDLPFADNSFDTVVLPLVLCSVRDMTAALAEVRRILRPDGQVLVMEHVHAGDDGLLNRAIGAAQDAMERPWMALADGCHPNRRTREALREAEFDVSGLRRVVPRGLVPGPMSILLVGRAVPAVA